MEEVSVRLGDVVVRGEDRGSDRRVGRRRVVRDARKSRKRGVLKGVTVKQRLCAKAGESNMGAPKKKKKKKKKAVHIITESLKRSSRKNMGGEEEREIVKERE